MDQKYNALFTPWKIGNVEIKNRIVMCSMGGTSLFGWMEPSHFDKEAAYFLLEKARNGVGLVLPGMQWVRDVMGNRWLYNNKSLYKPLKEYMKEFHKTGSKLFIQLAAGCGRSMAVTDMIGMCLDHPIIGKLASPIMDAEYLCASASDTPNRWKEDYKSKPLTVEQIQESVAAFGKTAKLLREAGVDGVEIHAVHEGYTLDQFAIANFNYRTDQYGGSLENRARFPLMILKKIREAVGKHFIVEILISGEEDKYGGYTRDDTVAFLRMAAPYVDIAQIRASDADGNHPTNYTPEEVPTLDVAAYIKSKNPGVLITTVGGWHNPDTAERAIAEGKLDLVSMARAWISNPDYGQLIYEDRAEDIVPCLRCNKCHGRGPNDPFVSVCSVNPKLGIEHRLEVLTRAPGPSQRIAVVGGGPAGMKAAIDLCDRGHQVTLFEQQGELGGLIRHADFVDFKWTLKDFKDYLIRQVGKRDIDVRLNTRATPAMIAALGFDRVIAALGSVPAKPPIPGIDGPNVISGLSAMLDCRQAGDRVVVIGGGEVGVEAGIHLAKTGRQVTVLEMRDKLAADSTIMHFRSMFKAYWEGVPTFCGLCSVTVTGVTPEGVRYLDAAGAEQFLPADTVVVSTGMTPLREQALDFYGSAGRFYLIGDCKKPGTVQSAMRDAFAAASQI